MFGQGKQHMQSDLEKKPSGLYATKKESVLDTITKVNTAFEEGTISEAERDDFVVALSQMLEYCED